MTSRVMIKGSHILREAHALVTVHTVELGHTRKKYSVVYYGVTFEKQQSVPFLNVNVCDSGI